MGESLHSRLPIPDSSCLTRDHLGRKAEAVGRDLQGRLAVVGLAANLGDGDDHVKHLFDREMVTDLAGVGNTM